MFFVQGLPITQGSMKHVGRGRMIHVKQKELMAWRAKIGIEARKAGVQKVQGAVSVTLSFTLPRAKSVKRELPHVKPDLDKLVRACLDGLTGVAYYDDGQVVKIISIKSYGFPTGVLVAINE